LKADVIPKPSLQQVMELSEPGTKLTFRIKLQKILLLSEAEDYFIMNFRRNSAL
jgi:hypothetical protein